MADILPQPADHRLTIGFLLTEARGWTPHMFLSGVADFCAENDLNLVFYMGEALTERQAEDGGFYRLARAADIDGVIIASNIALNLSAEAKQRLHDQFRNKPLIGWALEVPGLPSVLPDSYNGMKQAVNHLAQAHRYRRIAFIRGPDGQLEAEQRYQAYLDALDENNLPLNLAYVQAGNFSRESGQAAMQRLLALEPRPDAVVAANDDMAIGALMFLQSRGLRVPKDVALVGFDDIEESRYLNVPLTTVRQSFYTAGRHAAEAVLQRIRKQNLDVPLNVPTELRIRRSCGCLPADMQHAAPPLLTDLRFDPVEQLWQASSAALDNTGDIAAEHRALRRTLTQVWQALTLTLGGAPTETFLRTFDEALRETRLARGEAVPWHDVLSVLRQCALSQNQYDPARRHQVEDLCQQARVLVSDSLMRVQAYRRVLIEKKDSILQHIGRTLRVILDLKELPAALEQLLPLLDIRTCVLALHDGSPNARLLLRYFRGRMEFPEERLLFPASQLDPQNMLLEGPRHTVVVMPLALGSHQLGFLAVEYTPAEWEVYARFREIVAGAVFRTQRTEELARFNEMLERMVQQRTDELNQAYHQLERLDKTKSSFIEITAHELRTPLTVLKGYTQILQTMPAIKNDEQARMLLDGILNGATRMHELVNSMLDVVKVDSHALNLRPGVIPLNSLIRRVISGFEAALVERRQTLRVDEAIDSLPPVEGDGDLLSKVFYQLVVNAIKYTPDGGSITITGTTRNDPAGQMVEITVADTGIGIDPAHHRLIFEKFYQTGQVSVHSSGRTKFKGGGPGLGLAIARGIVEAHGGRIWAESPGHDETTFPGSRFHVALWTKLPQRNPFVAR